MANLRRLAWLGGRCLVGLWEQLNPLTQTLYFLFHLHRRIPVLDVAGPHLPSAFPVLWPCESPGVCGYPLFWADPWEQKVLRPLPHSPAVPELSIPQGPGADMAPVCALCSGMLRQEPAVACSTSILSPRSSGCSGLVDTRSWGPGPPPGLPHVGLQGNPMG